MANPISRGNFLLTREDLAESPDGLQYFEQTLIDGIVLVVYTYPSTAEDRDAFISVLPPNYALKGTSVETLDSSEPSSGASVPYLGC